MARPLEALHARRESMVRVRLSGPGEDLFLASGKLIDVLDGEGT